MIQKSIFLSHAKRLHDRKMRLTTKKAEYCYHTCLFICVYDQWSDMSNIFQVFFFWNTCIVRRKTNFSQFSLWWMFSFVQRSMYGTFGKFYHFTQFNGCAWLNTINLKKLVSAHVLWMNAICAKDFS